MDNYGWYNRTHKNGKYVGEPAKKDRKKKKRPKKETPKLIREACRDFYRKIA